MGYLARRCCARLRVRGPRPSNALGTARRTARRDGVQCAPLSGTRPATSGFRIEREEVFVGAVFCGFQSEDDCLRLDEKLSTRYKRSPLGYDLPFTPATAPNHHRPRGSQPFLTGCIESVDTFTRMNDNYERLLTATCFSFSVHHSHSHVSPRRVLERCSWLLHFLCCRGEFARHAFDGMSFRRITWP